MLSASTRSQGDNNAPDSDLDTCNSKIYIKGQSSIYTAQNIQWRNWINFSTSKLQASFIKSMRKVTIN